MIAMVAVGVWSAQLGGRAMLFVPMAFLCSMLFGGALGFEHVRVVGTELGISMSVLFLGVAIATESKVTLALAAAGVALFGICHGFAHGSEIPGAENRLSYTAGFMLTTACLHLVGAAGCLLLLEEPAGRRWLQLAGVVAATTGTYLSVRALAL